jgi:hypothetical protein
MKNLVVMSAIAAMISACGGGGGGGGETGRTPAAESAPPVNKLAAYVGNWSTDCNDHKIGNATITSPSNNTIKITSRTDYHTGADCTGAIIATETDGVDVTGTYTETVDSSIVFTQGAAATLAKVDKFTASFPRHTHSVTGTGVTHVVVNGQAQWCIDFGGGNQTCIWDRGTYPDQNGIPDAAYLQGNVLYELEPSGSLYVVNARFNKR